MIIGYSNEDVEKNQMIKDDFGYCLERLNIIGKLGGERLEWDTPFDLIPENFSNAINSLLSDHIKSGHRSVTIHKNVFLSKA